MIPVTDDIRIKNTSWTTWTLIGLNTRLFFWTLIIPEWRLERVFALFGAVPARLTHPTWASYQGFPDGGLRTLLSSLFLHGGFLHWLAKISG